MNEVLLNVSFGIYALLPQGWIFMAFIIFLECFLMSFFLARKAFDGPVCVSVILSNALSGIFGIILSMALNGGWWMVVWFPWVSDQEVSSVEMIMPYYLAAFILTVLIELVVNRLMLSTLYTNKRILLVTLAVNVISYTVGSFFLYSYSFS